jgi:hypothetical protein
VRGSSRSTRPGTRPTTDRSATPRRPRPERPSQLEAAEVIAEDIVEDHPAEAAAELDRVARTTHSRHRTKPNSLLASRAATEYVYVAQDLRRILAVAGLLFGVLILLWLVVVMLKVIPVQFY